MVFLKVAMDRGAVDAASLNGDAVDPDPSTPRRVERYYEVYAKLVAGGAAVRDGRGDFGPRVRRNRTVAIDVGADTHGGVVPKFYGSRERYFKKNLCGKRKIVQCGCIGAANTAYGNYNHRGAARSTEVHEEPHSSVK